MVETNFYPQAAPESAKASPTENELEAMLLAIRNNPEVIQADPADVAARCSPCATRHCF